MGWDGMGWDGMGWDGMGWDGMVQASVRRKSLMKTNNGEVSYLSRDMLKATVLQKILSYE
jgi:hypothetical protein